MATLLKKILTTLLLTAIFLLCSCDTETTDTHTDEKTQSPLVGIWETEESFNQKNGFKYIYEINSNGKAAFSMEYIFDVNPDGETVLIKKGEYLKVEGTASTTADKITITDMKVANDSTMSKEMIAQMIQEPLNDMEIEYKDLTQTSVKIKNVYCDDDGNEIEEWITLRKVTNTNSNNNTGNSDNKNDNTESRIIGSWENTQTIDADGNSAEMKITYVISADKFTTIAEYNFMGTQITDTIDGTITKITDGTIYYTFVSPEDGITEAESVAIYKDLTADSVKFKGIDAYGNEVWLTFTKKTNTNNNDNKNDNTEYSIIGSWGFTQTIENTDGTSMEMKVTYVITADKITSYAEVNGQKSTYEMTITKIENGKIYCIGLSPIDNTTEIESILMYKDLTADSVKITTYSVEESDTWIIFTKVKM